MLVTTPRHRIGKRENYILLEEGAVAAVTADIEPPAANIRKPTDIFEPNERSEHNPSYSDADNYHAAH